jgi:enoyl-CoA hydratase/carnithine racemase
MAEGIADAIRRLDRDAEIAVAVITGAGKGFSAGMDLKAFGRGERAIVGDAGFAGIARRRPGKPLIAAIEGFAVAGGLEIALACDLIVAARGARLGLPEVTRSIVATAGGLRHLPRRVPYHVAMEIILTGEPIDAERAHAVGLVNRIAEPGSALGVALELAEVIERNGPLAVRASKRIVAEGLTWSDEEFWLRQDQIAESVQRSADAREGALAFVEKRAPVWRGR